MDGTNLEKNFQKYISHCRYEKGLNAKTLKAYQIDLSQFMIYVEKMDEAINKNTIQSYIIFLHSKYKIKTVKRKIASLKAFFNYLEYEEVLLPNPFSQLRIKLHEPSLLPRIIPLETIACILQYGYLQQAHLSPTKYEYRACTRDIAVLELLFATGMRISELCSLHEEDVDITEGIIKIYGKGSKERIVQIGNQTVLHAVKSYYNTFNNEIHRTGFFFLNRFGNRLSEQSVRFMINKYCKKAGIDQHITPHMFRHSFATYLLEEDVDIRYIQHLLGHSSITTTQIYTHVTSKKQRDILTERHPRNKIII